MRFAKLHPSFLIFFFLSLASIAAGLVLAIASIDACGDVPNARCTIEAQGEQTMATVLAIGGLTAMLGGVGFQIGRARPEPAPAFTGYPQGAQR